MKLLKRRNQNKPAGRRAEPLSRPKQRPKREENDDFCAGILDDIDDDDSIRGLIAPFLTDQSETKFDLMQVNITIYGLNGILGNKGERRRNRSKKKERRKKMKKPLDSEVTDSIDSFDFSLDPADAGVPITAVVSCRRHAFSSGSTMETFLPSSPLRRISNSDKGSGGNRYKASWMKEGIRRDYMETDPCTFKIIRAMKREGYRPDLKIEEIENYSHETVDLQIFIGQGKNMIPIGAASLVVTGDEEGEVILNLPAKATASPQQETFTDGKRSRKKKGFGKPAFSHNPNTLFSLAQNAFLRVGVRVSPYIDKSPVCTVVYRKKKQTNGQGLDENVVIELEDENSLIAQFLAGEGGGNVCEKEIIENGNNKIPTLQAGCRAMQEMNRTLSPKVQENGGCCNNPWQIIFDTFSFWQHHDNKRQNCQQDSQMSSNRKTGEAVLLPSTLMSSVSESTDYTPEEMTPTTAGQDNLGVSELGGKKEGTDNVKQDLTKSKKEESVLPAEINPREKKKTTQALGKHLESEPLDVQQKNRKGSREKQKTMPAIQNQPEKSKSKGGRTEPTAGTKEHQEGSKERALAIVKHLESLRVASGKGARLHAHKSKSPNWVEL